MSTIQSVQAGADPRLTGRTSATGREDPASARAEKAGAGNVSAQPAPAEPAVPVLEPEESMRYAEAVQKILAEAAPETHKITFRPDETTNGYVIEVRDPDGVVIRQFPPEKLLNLRRKLDELSGMVIDEMT